MITLLPIYRRVPCCILGVIFVPDCVIELHSRGLVIMSNCVIELRSRGFVIMSNCYRAAF
jgi:hypothetical protein